MEDDNELDYSAPDQTDTELEDGQGLPSEQPVASRAMAAPAPLIMRGAPGTVTAPTSAAAFPSPEELANKALWARLQYRFANEPVADTEAAVAAALKYQALRQFQSDVAAGTNPAVALSRNAPLMFAGPRQATLGHAASFIQATRPQGTKLRDVGGVLYRENSDGSVTPLTPPKTSTPRINQFDLSEYNSVLGQIAKVRQESADDRIGDQSYYQHQATLQILESQLKDIRKRAQGTSSGSTNTGRIRVRAPSGRWGSIPASRLQDALKLGYTQD